jgi:hypothetical protein
MSTAWLNDLSHLEADKFFTKIRIHAMLLECAKSTASLTPLNAKVAAQKMRRGTEREHSRLPACGARWKLFGFGGQAPPEIFFLFESGVTH